MEGKGIFNGPGKPVFSTDLGRIVTCLGEPPKQLLLRQVRPGVALNEHGKLNVRRPLSDFSLEAFVTKYEGQQKTVFINFLRRILTGLPEERATAGELLADPYLQETREHLEAAK